MFQSSRMASGMTPRQASIACSPSSASEIDKSKPSRIRRATLRITLESSTTKQVFMTSSLPCEPSARNLRFAASRCRQCFGRKQAVDVDNDHDLRLQPMHAGGHLGDTRVEIDRIVVAAA